MAKRIRLKALDFIIVASHFAASGKTRQAMDALIAATEEEDFGDTLTTLDAGNDEGWLDGEPEEPMDDDTEEVEDEEEDEVDQAFASLQRTRRRRAEKAADVDVTITGGSDSDSDEDNSEAEDKDNAEAEDEDLSFDEETDDSESDPEGDSILEDTEIAGTRRKESKLQRNLRILASVASKNK